MNGNELVALARLLKITGKAASNVADSISKNEDYQKMTNAAGKEIKSVTRKGLKLIGNCFTRLNNNDLRHMADLLTEIESRTKEYEGIDISDKEIKKLISRCNHPHKLYNAFLKYLLLLYAVKIRGMSGYLKQLTEIKSQVDMLHSEYIDEELLNVKTEAEISVALRVWITVSIDSILLEIEDNEKYIKSEDML